MSATTTPTKLTGQERIAQATENAAETAGWYLSMATERVEKATAAIADKGHANPVDCQWSYLTEYIEAVADRDCWLQIARNAKNGASAEGAKVTTEHTLGAMRFMADRWEQDLLGNRYRGNSTNPMSNAANAAQAEATSRALRTVKGALAHIANVEAEVAGDDTVTVTLTRNEAEATVDACNKMAHDATDPFGGTATALTAAAAKLNAEAN